MNLAPCVVLGVIVGVLGLAACAPALPVAPETTVLTGVEGRLGPWTGTAARVQLIGGTAWAEDVHASTGAGSGAGGQPADASAVPLLIEAATSEWDLKGKTATFRKDVKVTRGAVTLTADSLDVRYKDADHVDVVTATGRVVLTRGGRVARSGIATLTAGDGRVVLTGNPTLTEGVNEPAGARIEVWLDEEKAVCSGATAPGAVVPCRLKVTGGF